MTSFADLGLAEPLLEALHDVGYEEPSPIQAQTIPLLLDWLVSVVESRLLVWRPTVAETGGR